MSGLSLSYVADVRSFEPMNGFPIRQGIAPHHLYHTAQGSLDRGSILLCPGEQIFHSLILTRHWKFFQQLFAAIEIFNHLGREISLSEHIRNPSEVNFVSLRSNSKIYVKGCGQGSMESSAWPRNIQFAWKCTKTAMAEISSAMMMRDIPGYGAHAISQIRTTLQAETRTLSRSAHESQG